MARRLKRQPKVSRDWLFGEFEKRNLVPGDVAEEFFQARTYFNNCETSGLNAQVIDRLKTTYNIDVEAYINARNGEPEQMSFFSREEELLFEILKQLREITESLKEGTSA